MTEIQSNIRKIAFLAIIWPRQMRHRHFTSDLLGAVAAERPNSQCFAGPVNDIEGDTIIPTVVALKFRSRNCVPTAADFLNINMWISCVCSMSSGFTADRPEPSACAAAGASDACRDHLAHNPAGPDADQKRVMNKLIARSTRLVLMTEKGRGNAAWDLRRLRGKWT